MNNITQLETSFQTFIKDLPTWLPDGIQAVDLFLLHELGLLKNNKPSDKILTQNFHVIETQEKITLFNKAFAVWIIPEITNGISNTFVLIADNSKRKPKLEMGYSTSGVYNNSPLVLKVLEALLIEIEETNLLISEIKKKQEF